MAIPEKDLRFIRKKFKDVSDKIPEKIRLGNHFVDDFIFEDHQAADIPINALRVIFNIISIISNEQFRPEDRPKQLSLFDEEFETENNVFALMKIRNNKISPSGSTKQVVDAYEFLAKFKMTWYRSLNSKGKEIRTFGGLISAPSYDQRGFTSFLISSYWLKKLIVIPEYNYVLYNLVYNIRNNKHIIFAIWLAKLPESGTVLKLETFNIKFGLNYKSTNDFCFKFLEPAKRNFNKFNTLSFDFRCKGDAIFIQPYDIKMLDENISEQIKEQPVITRRLRYLSQRYGLQESESIQFFHQYRNNPQTRELIEKAFRKFKKNSRSKGEKSTGLQGKAFLNEIQQFIILIYKDTQMGKIFPNGYPIIL